MLFRSLMTPIFPGVLASGISGHLAPAITGNYEAIASYTVPSGGVSSINFAGIPSTYSHLQIRALAKGSSGSDLNVYLQFNGDTGSNYRTHALYGTGSSSASAYASSQQTLVLAGRIAGGSDTASAFGALVLDVLDYANTNKNKVTRDLSGWDGNGSGSIWLESGLWLNTNAVSSITLTADANFAQYSSFTLYGIQ